MARPKQALVKDKHVSFRLSAEEHFRLLDKATRSGMTIGEFVRARSLQARKRAPKDKRSDGGPMPDAAAAFELCYLLRKHGVLLNQIAKHCNTYLVPPPPSLEPLLTEIRILFDRFYFAQRD